MGDPQVRRRADIPVRRLPWCLVEDFRFMRALLGLSLTYEEWLHSAVAKERELQAQGRAVLRVVVDLDAFMIWCNSHGRIASPRAVQEFVDTLALEG